MPTSPEVDRTAQRDRHIRVFISSTFRDMHAERNHLVTVIFPQLRRLCEARGVIWGEVDLRWGIPDEEKAEGKVLPICLEEIKRCRPYFIGLLGERYGWIPDAIAPEVIEREPWLREHVHGKKSVTELEILHGVLREEAMHGQAFFYFRDPGYLDHLPPGCRRADFESEGPEARAKLTQLKQGIRHARDEAVCRLREDYRDPQQLGQWLLEDFTQLINDLFAEGSQPDPLTRESLDHAAYARSRERVYIGRPEYFQRLDAYAVGSAVSSSPSPPAAGGEGRGEVGIQDQNSPLVILGESGSGKSALLANWAARYRQAHPDAFVPRTLHRRHARERRLGGHAPAHPGRVQAAARHPAGDPGPTRRPAQRVPELAPHGRRCRLESTAHPPFGHPLPIGWGDWRFGYGHVAVQGVGGSVPAAGEPNRGRRIFSESGESAVGVPRTTRRGSPSARRGRESGQSPTAGAPSTSPRPSRSIHPAL